MRRVNKIICKNCGRDNLDRNTIGINKKLLGENVTSFYCMDCLAVYLDVTVQDLRDKIEEFKEEGCKLFS